MIDKRRQIIEAAVQCFAEKGFHATSIQEIADRLGMAKGSLYFYFKSKEDLLVSIVKHYVDLSFCKFQALAEDPGLLPQDRLYQQVMYRFTQFTEQRDFILLFLKERFAANEEFHELIHSLRAQSLWSLHKCILLRYGSEAGPYAFDAATIFNAMIDGYMGYMWRERVKLDPREITPFLLARLDDLLTRMISQKTAPLLNAEIMEPIFAAGQRCMRKPREEAFDAIEAIRRALETQPLAQEQREELEEALDVIEAELGKTEPQTVMLKGMTALLKNGKIPGIKKHIAKLETNL